MTEPSDEQLKIIAAPLAPMSVIACAGSGKTFTAVRRLAEIRRQLGDQRGRVALLSFSNVAVETFRREYQNLVRNASIGVAYSRVEIDTLDSFITGNVLRPHAYRTMGARKAAFLATGGEPFLNSFKFRTDTYPREIATLQVGAENGCLFFYYADRDKIRRLDAAYASGIVARLGRVGAYAHNLGRYWCYRTLADQPGILRALAHRYPHILIDEAQDIGTVHQAIIEQLAGAGCQVSLIGDPNQGIYEFAGADGSFLKQFGQRAGVIRLGLTRNYRSVPAILSLANRLSGRADTTHRSAPEATHGAFFVPYRNNGQEDLVAAFQASVAAAGLRRERSAVLCRGRDLTDRLAGHQEAPGKGIVKGLAQAAIHRDRKGDLLSAYKKTVACIVALLAEPPEGLISSLTNHTHHPEFRPLRRRIWAFTRSSDSGLPASTLAANSQWHPLMLERTRTLLDRIVKEHGLALAENLGNRLAKTGLSNAPLFATADSGTDTEPMRIRVDTVHQVKGESLDAVLYLASREHLRALLDGVDTELGRIGYVAVTRARNLLWLGVPANSMKNLRPELAACGLREYQANG